MMLFACRTHDSEGKYDTKTPCDAFLSEHIDYELDRDIRLLLNVTSDRIAYQLSLTIDIYDVNEPPVDISLSNTIVSESLVRNAVIGRLTSRDPDRGSEVTYVKLLEKEVGKQWSQLERACLL